MIPSFKTHRMDTVVQARNSRFAVTNERARKPLKLCPECRGRPRGRIPLWRLTTWSVVMWSTAWLSVSKCPLNPDGTHSSVHAHRPAVAKFNYVRYYNKSVLTAHIINVWKWSNKLQHDTHTMLESALHRFY